MRSTGQFRRIFLKLGIVFLLVQCGQKKGNAEQVELPAAHINSDKTKADPKLVIDKPVDLNTPEGMVWIPGGEFMQGAIPEDQMAMPHEKPAHKVTIDGFFIDITEVTNAQYKTFVEATGYITVAERKIDWEELKKQVPEGTPKPHDSIMQPGSLTFKKTKSSVPNLYDFSQWWNWTIGANWMHPNGPGSNIKGKENHPVVQIAYEDALAYCEWAGKRLPTEAEWERAARGTKKGKIYFWGNDASALSQMANSWEGEFPVNNTLIDGFERRSPVKSYPPNDFGLYDMAGNVWEWTNDWYRTDYYNEISKENMVSVNPKGAVSPYNVREPYAKEKIMKGGSFLCNASYCASYRVSSRMATNVDSSLEHLGFRTAASVAMVRNMKNK
jgi:formylglycine-generating enzyme required for sulfatase activity